ncbi:RAMP superfamily CRISPR-associated protein [Streptomyces sp. NPDC004838]
MTDHRGRPMARRLRVRGWLRTRSPLHIGGAGQRRTGLLTTMATDGLGRPYVPGTGLAGALRTAAERAPCADVEYLRSLWGWMEPDEQGGTASRVVVRDALLTADTTLDEYGMPSAPLDPAHLETRFSVGIDRVTGTAAHGFLHGRAVVPRGTFLRLEFDIESAPATADADAEHLRFLLRSLRHGRIRLGTAKTRGLGRVELITDQTTVHEQDLTSPAGLVAALGHGPAGSGWCLDDELGTDPPPGPWLTARVDWRPAAPLMVRAAADGIDIKALPYTRATSPGQVALVLPGSALKGRLRAQAERIERTVRQLDDLDSCADNGDDEARRSAAFRHQLDRLPSVRALFGATPAAAAVAESAAGGGTGSGRDAGPDRGAGAVTVDDCFATSSVPQALWNTLLGIVPDDGQQATGTDTDTSAGLPGWAADHGFARADHVAIDRWTGGAAEGRLFSVLEPTRTSWEPLTLTVDPARLDAHGGMVGHAAMFLFLLVLRDLAEGRIPLGWGTNRGMGDITVDAVTLTLPDRATPVSLDEYLAGPEAAELNTQWHRYLDDSDESAV